MNDLELSSLALFYSKMGNGVTAFYVVQTLLFLHSVYKEPRLLRALCTERILAQRITWIIAFVYLILIMGCFTLEIYLLPDCVKCKVIVASLFTVLGRILLVFTLALGCTQLITKYLKYDDI